MIRFSVGTAALVESSADVLAVRSRLRSRDGIDQGAGPYVTPHQKQTHGIATPGI